MKMFRKFRLTVTRGRAERKPRQLLFFLRSDFISIRRAASHLQTDFKEGGRPAAVQSSVGTGAGYSRPAAVQSGVGTGAG